MRRKKNNVFAGLFAGALFAVIGFCVVFFAAKPTLDNAKQSKNWPTAIGVITHSDIDQEFRKGKTMYSAEIGYKFSANGQEYVGHTVSFAGMGSSSHSAALNVTDRYPMGREVSVYYDGKDPNKNVLEPGVRASAYLMYGIGWLFLIAGVLIFASSAFRIFAGAAIIGGAAAGALGSKKRSRNPRDSINPPNFDHLGSQTGGRNDQPGDDGIDIG